jgi:hypothetical protein
VTVHRDETFTLSVSCSQGLDYPFTYRVGNIQLLAKRASDRRRLNVQLDLLVAEGLDGIQAGGADGWVDAEDDTNESGYAKCDTE